MADESAPIDDYTKDDLFWASYNGHPDVLTFLFEAGVDPNTTNNQGETPLYFATRGGQAEMVELLLGAGADPNPPPTNDWNPLETAQKFGFSKIEGLLRDAGAECKSTKRKSDFDACETARKKKK